MIPLKLKCQFYVAYNCCMLFFNTKFDIYPNLKAQALNMSLFLKVQALNLTLSLKAQALNLALSLQAQALNLTLFLKA